ncbi:MAG: ECF transporter S component [Candidatus Borkfalkiaceae bacterium]|nr:ECF transporter S component [Christensenellaceae bacterium]
MKGKKALKTTICIAIVFVLIPAALFAGVTIFNDRNYMLVSAFVALLSCLPFFIAFETNENTGRELVVIAVMCAISVVGRLIFAPIPGFKPVTAVVIITGAVLGAEAGFITGSMTALCSNIFFGQGPWTPFQMFSWGIIGFISGLIFFKRQKKNLIFIIIAGMLFGVLFSLLMDIWTTVSVSGEFIVNEYIACVIAAIPVTIEYAVSNAVFLAVLFNPFNKKLERIKTKYGVFVQQNDAAPET